MAKRRKWILYRTLIAVALLCLSSAAWAGELADAAEKGDVKLVSELLAKGENPNDSKNGLTALILTNSAPVAVALIKAGADVNAKRANDGSTALIFAAFDGNFAKIKVLVESGADVNAVTGQGYRPIFFPCMEWYPPKYSDATALEVVTFLVDHKADVNAAFNGATARGMAASIGFVKVAQFLKDHGAKCSVASGLVMHNCSD